MEHVYQEQTEPERKSRVHLRDYLHTLKKRKWTIFTVALIIATLVLIFGLGKNPLYTSSTTVLVEQSNGGENLNMPYNFYRWDPEFLPTQIEIIKSKSVSRRVVATLQLDSKYLSYFFPDTQENTSNSDGTRQTVLNFFQQLFQPDIPVNTDKPEDEHPSLDQADSIAARIQSGIQVAPIPDTRVLNIRYTDRDPYMAQRIAEALANAYIEVSMEIKLSSSQQALKWMTTKAEAERKKLEESERALQKYKRENNFVTVENKLTVYPEKLAQASNQLSESENKLKELKAVYGQIMQLQGDVKALETIPAIANTPTLVSLRSQILKAEQLIKELSKKYGYKHPKMVKAVDDRNILLREKKTEIKRITASIRQDYELAQSKLQDLKKDLATTKTELLDVNERFIQYSIMNRELESNRALYDALTTSIKKASTTQDSQNINIWVMRAASLSKTPSNKNPKRILLMAMALGLAAGIGLALFIEYLDNTVKSTDELEQRFGVTVLGTIQEAKKGESIESIVKDNTRSPISESYRLIRSSLLLSAADHPPRTLLVTSVGPQEGKTTTSINLARTLAQGENKVLLIDADMRKPRIHTMFALANTVGLSSYLSGSSDDNIIHPLPGEYMHIIPAGPIPPNPAELLESKRMKKLLQEMSAQYDFIVFDSPPIGSLVDGLIISTLVDGTVLVARAGKTTYDAFNTGLKKILDIQTPILGVVLNSMSASLAGSTYYHYYEYSSKDGKHQT